MAKTKRHKWAYGKVKSGMVDACVKCPCVKEYISGRITYFLDDNVSEKAPECVG